LGDVAVSNANITQLLHDWVRGDSQSLEVLTPLVYGQLHQIAARIFRGEKSNHTLQTTALVHEAFARLVKVDVDWQDRSHFFALAARMMRRILVDHANMKAAARRGGKHSDLPLDDVIVVSPEAGEAILDLHEALIELANHDARKADILELHYFGGLTYEEMGEVLGLSSSTLDRDIRFAKAWLRAKLEE
jgi:RNA polymerase sigma factor (TIGR02999 family)